MLKTISQREGMVVSRGPLFAEAALSLDEAPGIGVYGIEAIADPFRPR